MESIQQCTACGALHRPDKQECRCCGGNLEQYEWETEGQTVSHLLSLSEQTCDGDLQRDLYKRIILSISREFCQQIADEGYSIDVPKSLLIDMISNGIGLCSACGMVRNPAADPAGCQNCGWDAV